MKRLYKYIICMLLGVCVLNVVYTERVYANISNEGNISNYLCRFYEMEQLQKVEDVNGEDVTDEFINRTQNLYEIGDMESIKRIIQEEELVLHIYSIENNNANVSTYGLTRYKNVANDEFYFLLTADNGVTLEVLSELRGGIWYDEGTGEVKRTSTPTYTILEIYTNSVSNITANDFSTGSNVSNGKGLFWGRCSFIGILIEQGFTFRANFGSKQVSFWAVP